MSTYKVQAISDLLTKLGEGPHWHKNNLYFIDILAKTIHRYDYGEKKVYTANIHGISYVGFVTPVQGTDDEFVIGADQKFIHIKWDGISNEVNVVKILAELNSENEIENRFNDGKADPKGRLYAGTMRQEKYGNAFDVEQGNFYRFDMKTKKFVHLKSKICISNGLAWNEKLGKFYYIDTKDQEVKEYDVNDDGDISNENVLISFKNCAEKILPDGMTIDSDGNLWVATFGASKVLKINTKTRKIEQEINIPAQQVTSVAFGGPNLDILYVTTAGENILGPQLPPAGATFEVSGLGVKGLPMNCVNLSD
uniref:Regucalcin n=1 Tax=Corethrella appendiculata TaxID=1370023 RepID=U5EWT8_9DIPT